MINDVRMRNFQGSQDRTVKITEINPVEDFAFTQCTSLILQFLFLLYFSMKRSSMKLNHSLRKNIESCVRMHKRKARDSKMKATHSLTHSVCKSVRQIYLTLFLQITSFPFIRIAKTELSDFKHVTIVQYLNKKVTHYWSNYQFVHTMSMILQF